MSEKHRTPFPSLGISLSYLLDTFPGSLQGNLTTSDVVKYIKSLKLKSSFCEHLRQKEGPTVVNQATKYVIHAHSFSFKDEFLACLDNYRTKAKASEEEFLWIDIFSLNLSQIGRELRRYDWFGGETFVHDLKDLKLNECLLIWPNPLLLTRTWCLYEIYILLVAQIPCSVCLSSSFDYQTLPEIVQSFMKVDIETSVCSDRRVFKKILNSVLKNEHSFLSFNSTVLLGVKEYFCALSFLLFEENKNLVNFEFLNSLTFLAKSTGNLKMAKEVSKEIIKKIKKEKGKVHPIVQSREYNNASVLFFQKAEEEDGDVIKAIEYGEESVDVLKDYIVQEMKKKEETNEFDGLVQERKHVATLLHNLANLYMTLDQFVLAEQRYLESVQLKTELFGPDDLLVAQGLNALGMAYFAMKKTKSAERVLRQSLQTRVRNMGMKSHGVAQTRYNLALVLEFEKMYEEAWKEASQGLEIVSKLVEDKQDPELFRFKQLVGRLEEKRKA